MLTLPVRQLGDTERPAVERLLDRDPYVAVAVAERVANYGVSRGDGAIYGYGARRKLESLCASGAHVVPVLATGVALAAFAELLGGQPRRCSSIVGEAHAVHDLWPQLETSWGPARAVRDHQPLLMTDAPPATAADPAVRPARPDELDLVWPAAVQMYTEEVGVSPLAEDGGRAHRSRLARLVRGARTYVRVADGEVIFKADLAVVSRHTVQVQGVWVAPAWRGGGVGSAAMAAVVRHALRRVAPTVSLYVNDYNQAARRMYRRCGFRQVGALATVLF